MVGPVPLDPDTAVRSPTKTTISINSNSHTTVKLDIDDPINDLPATLAAAGRNATL